MPAPLSHGRKGMKTIPLGDYNAMIDAARYVQQRRGDGGAGRPTDSIGQMPALVHNDSGSDVGRFAVLSIGDPIILPSTSEDGFAERLCFVGDTPATGDEGKYVVTLEPIPDGSIGQAVLAGAVQCVLYVNSESDTYAEISDGHADYLATATTGSARILWKASGTGEVWGVVRLGETPAATDGASFAGYRKMNDPVAWSPGGSAPSAVGSILVMDATYQMDGAAMRSLAFQGNLMPASTVRRVSAFMDNNVASGNVFVVAPSLLIPSVSKYPQWFPSAVRVSGITGVAAWNGDYVMDSALYNGMPAYTNGVAWIWWDTGSGGWMLSLNKGQGVFSGYSGGVPGSYLLTGRSFALFDIGRIGIGNGSAPYYPLPYVTINSSTSYGVSAAGEYPVPFDYLLGCSCIVYTLGAWGYGAGLQPKINGKVIVRIP